jgi:spore maturation protein CgeB
MNDNPNFDFNKEEKIMVRVLFLDNNSMWIHGLPNGFKDAGHEVMISGVLTKENISSIISNFCPQIIFSIGYNSEHTLQKQRWIYDYVHKSGIPHVYWATEDPGYTATCSLLFIQNSRPDFVFTICSSRVEFYKNLGIKAAHLDFGYHKSVHSPVQPIEEYKYPVAVIANAYPKLFEQLPNHYRLKYSINNLIKPLLENELPISFYGHGWEKMSAYIGVHIPFDAIKGYVPYTELRKIYSSTKIIIGLQNHPTQLTQRTYEVLGSGGFLLTNDTPEVRRIFKPNHDLIVSSSSEETLKLVQFYLENPDSRNKIRENGRKTVSKYSYRQRADYIIRTLQDEGIFEGATSIYDMQAIEEAINNFNFSESYSKQNLKTISKISERFDIPINKLLRINKFP